jgi:hypothetical protein
MLPEASRTKKKKEKLLVLFLKSAIFINSICCTVLSEINKITLYLDYQDRQRTLKWK